MGKGVWSVNVVGKIGYLYSKIPPSVYKNLVKMDHRFIKFLEESIGEIFSILG